MTQSPGPSDTAPGSTVAPAKPVPARPLPMAPRVKPVPAASGWKLAPGAEPYSREELLARFRRQRALPDDPFAELGKPTPPPGYRDRIMSQTQPAARFLPPDELEEEDVAAPQKAPFTLNLSQTFAIAAAMALVAGAGVGFLSAKLYPRGAAPVELAATPLPVQAGMAEAAPSAQPRVTSTVITKKPVPTATLVVADAAGETNSFIPLALRAEPADTGSDILLKISGIPEGAYLTSGRKQDDAIWALTRAELKDLKLVIPNANEREIGLSVAAFEPKTGELAAPVKTMTVALSDVVVQPASAPPPTQAVPVKAASSGVGQPAAIPPPHSMRLATQSPEVPEARRFVLEGDGLLKSGDVRQARASYEQAWAAGSPAGAYGVARTYDPVVLGALALKNDTPDKAKALAWYERAATGGNTDAADAIVRLRLKP